MSISDFLNTIDLSLFFKILGTIIGVFVLYYLLSWFLNLTKTKLLQKAKGKKEKSNVKIFFRVAQYTLVSLLIIFAILSYTGSLTGIGITAGLLSAALGWALQRPITGVAAWLMVVIKRPFEIGDRVIIGNVKGDVVDITLTHIHIGEIGGTIASEESSGRVILIPNAKLFEQDIINYTKQNELILDQVKFIVTFESNIKKAKEIGKEAANQVLKGYRIDFQPYVRTWFTSYGIDVTVRYYVPASRREEVSSEITYRIFEKINSQKEVELAYPHTEVVFRKKGTIK